MRCHAEERTNVHLSPGRHVDAAPEDDLCAHTDEYRAAAPAERLDEFARREDADAGDQDNTGHVRQLSERREHTAIVNRPRTRRYRQPRSPTPEAHSSSDRALTSGHADDSVLGSRVFAFWGGVCCARRPGAERRDVSALR